MITHTQVAEAFKDSFLKPDIYLGKLQVIDSPYGYLVYPQDESPYPCNKEAAKQHGVDADKVETVMGCAVRLTAPGYLDSTEWERVDNEQRGLERLLEMADE